MHDRPGDIFTERTLYKQGSASIKLCLIDIALKAQARNAMEIEKRAQEALQCCATVQSLEYDWNKHRKSGPPTRADAVDTNHQITNSLTLMNSIVTSHADSRRDSTQRRAARRIKKALFPDGVQVISGLKYEDKHTSVSEICNRLETTFKDDVPLVGLTPHLEDLLELNETFSHQLAVNDEQIVFNAVEKARIIAEDAFHIVLTLVLAATIDDMDDRKNFLSSVTDQQARIANEMKTRKTKASADDKPADDTVKNIITTAELGADIESDQTPKSPPKSQSTDPQNNTESGDSAGNTPSNNTDTDDPNDLDDDLPCSDS